MALQMPNSVSECLYFTNRTIDADGKVIAWVEKKLCPKCKKAKMGKPVEKGKVKIRAKEYVCPACQYTEQKVEHEESCTLSIMYTCPYCKHKGETQIPYKRGKFDGIPAFIFECEKCKKKIPITKKLKEKGSSADDDDE
jgi:hypothetical protein